MNLEEKDRTSMVESRSRKSKVYFIILIIALLASACSSENGQTEDGMYTKSDGLLNITTPFELSLVEKTSQTHVYTAERPYGKISFSYSKSLSFSLSPTGYKAVRRGPGALRYELSIDGTMASFAQMDQRENKIYGTYLGNSQGVITSDFFDLDSDRFEIDIHLLSDDEVTDQELEQWANEASDMLNSITKN